MDEKELVKNAKNDKKAFEQLYEIYFDKIYSYIYYKTYNHYITEDLTSETFFKVMRNISKYIEKEDIPFSAWIFKIAQNTVNDYYRKKKVFIELDKIENSIQHDINVEEQVLKKIDNKKLIEALNKLTEEQREVVILRYGSNLKLNQIAKIKNKSEVAIRGLFFRAVNSLRNLLKEVCADEQK